MNETDWFYYIALAIATFVVIYIIYISLQFQNNMMEGFSIGGVKKDKKDETNAEKAADTIDDKNTKLEDALKISDNKEAFMTILESMKKNLNLSVMTVILNLSNSNGSDENISKEIGVYTAGLKHSLDGIEELEAFLKSN